MFLWLQLFFSITESVMMATLGAVAGPLFGIHLRFLIMVLVKNNNRVLFTERLITVSEEGVADESELNKLQLKWAAVQKLRRTSWGLLLYVTEQNALIIPRHAFASGEEFAAFCEFCRARVK